VDKDDNVLKKKWEWLPATTVDTEITSKAQHKRGCGSYRNPFYFERNGCRRFWVLGSGFKVKI